MAALVSVSLPNFACRGRSVPRRGRLTVRVAGSAEQLAGASRGQPSGGPLELKGGALWWQHLHAGASASAPLYGTNFVLQRQRVGGPGLVRVVQPPKPVIRSPPPAAGPPVVWAAPGAAGLALAGSHLGSGSLVIDTDFEVLAPSENGGAAMAPNTTCVGLVWQPSEAGPDGGVQRELTPVPRNSKHPRRTQGLRFTCNLCGEVNDAAVNPHAWRAGSVLARCQGCTAVHKLRDNLNIFHELAGPVFPPPELRANYLVQEILDRIRDKNSPN